MLVRDNPRLALYQIADGALGTRQTLRLMAMLVRDAVRGDIAIRSKAADLVESIHGHAFRDQARVLFEFVRDQIRWLGDVAGVETIQAPEVTLTVGYGDCDDKSTLLAALLMSIGHPARFVAVGFSRPNEFQHVYVETKIGADWVAMDPSTEFPMPMGWSALAEERPSGPPMRETV